ncbi:putative peptidase m61 domain-containing protein [Diaporthe ampelina]|uniref:Putative peptidase m61 domain-containing protein n=1 Tax=Diaporthe ampelina TaxID=1214573 RepID=A0A0G2H3S7_9PEZI|nr:putative peptidase m61 domain-containing protein [Diaporthe ampelina]
MAGPVKSNTNDPTSPNTQSNASCGMYWFGDLPPNLEAVAKFAVNTFPRMAEHFNDAPGSYRAFSRRTPKGFQGTAFQSSSIIEYDLSVKDEQDWDLVRLLNRTIVSAWARLDLGEDCGGGGFANAWFTDGLSLLYTVFLPSRFGQRGPDYFRATVNGRQGREMLDEGGKVNELDDMLSSFGARFGPQPVEQESLECGFSRESLGTGSVGIMVLETQCLRD